MTTEDTTVAVSADTLVALQTEVAQLADLFKRRLFDDRAKSSLIETLQEQVRTANDLLRYRNFESLFREALLAVDRLQQESLSPELADSVVAELLEAFYRRDLIEVDDSGEFDPRVHEVVATVAAVGGLQPNTIAAIQRKGYLLGDRLLRPAQVTLAVSVDEQPA